MRKTLKILFLAVMLVVMVGMTMLFASAEGESYEVAKITVGSSTADYVTTVTTSFGTYATFDEAVAALAANTEGANAICIKGDLNLVLDADLTVKGYLVLDGASVSITGQSHTLTALGFHALQNGGVLTINGGTYELSGAQGFKIEGGASADVQNATFNFTHTSGWTFFAVTGTDAEGTYGMSLKNVTMTTAYKYAFVSFGGRRVLVEGGSYQGTIYNKGGYIDIKGDGYFDGEVPSTDYLVKFASGSGTGTINIYGGTFVGAKGNYMLTATVASKLNIYGGTFKTPDDYSKTNPVFQVNHASAVCVIEGGTFIQGSSASASLLTVKKGKLTINGGNFYSSGYFFSCSSGTTTTVNSGTFHMEGGTTLAAPTTTVGLTYVTFNKTADKAPHFIIGNGAAIPSESIPGYNGHYANATWELQAAVGVEAVVNADLTITTITGLAAVADAAYESFFATALDGYNDIKLGEGGNCIVNKASDALASIIVPSGVTLTLAMEEAVDVAIPLVIVKAGGTLVIEKGVYTNTATEMFENEAGSTVTIKDGTFNLDTFNIYGNLTIKAGTFDLSALNIYGNLTIETGDFTLAAAQGFVVKVGGKADVQGGNFSFTLTSTHGFRVDVQSDAALADTEPSLTLGAGVNVLTDNRYAVVVYGNRKAEIKGGTYYGCLYVAGTLTIEDGYFYAGENTYNIASEGGYRRLLHPTNANSFSGSITVNGGTFMARTPAGNTDLAVRHQVGQNCSLTINGGTHTLTGVDGIGIYNVGTLVITKGSFTMPTLQSGATGSLEITDGNFTFTDKGNGSAINVLGTSSTISGGTFTADGNMILFAPEGEEVTLEVSGGTFTVKNGAAVAESFAGIILAPQDGDVNNLKFVIEAGSGAPSVNVEGASEACLNAYWDIRSWSGFEVRENTTFTSLADYAAAVKAYAESSVSEYNPAFIAGYNCEVNVEVTEWTHVVVVEGVLTLNMSLVGSGTLVTVEKDGTLIVAGGTYEVTGNDAIFVLNGGALEIQDGTYTAKAFVTDTADSTITVTGGTISIAVETTINGDVTISGGTIDATGKKVYFNGDVVIENVKFIASDLYINAGGTLRVTGGTFTLSSRCVIYAGATADLLGGDWDFTSAASYCFYLTSQTVTADFEEEPSVTFGGNLVKSSTNDYAFVVYPGRKAKIEGNAEFRSGRLFVSGTLDIYSGTFKDESGNQQLYPTSTNVKLDGSSTNTRCVGTITVYDGEFTGAYIYLTGGASLVINGGIFNLVGSTAGVGINNMGTITITSGTFNTATIKATDAGKYYISGGNFTFNGANNGYAIDAITDDNDTNSKSFAISGGATFTVNIDVPFVGLGQYASATFDNAKVIVKTFMDAATTGSMEILDMLLIVTGEDEVIFDIPATITKAVVVANTKNMTSDVTLSGYVQVKYGGELRNAWVKLPASAELSTEMEGGAAIEVTNPSKAGIRFKSTVSDALAAYLLDTYAGATFTFGTLIAPADYVAAAGGFTIEKLDALGLEIAYVDIVAKETLTGVDENGIPDSFSGALVNLKSYTRAYAAVSYVKVETADETVMIYGAFDSTANARSAQEIAVAAKADANGPYQDMHPTIFWSTEQKAIVDMYANGDNE